MWEKQQVLLVVGAGATLRWAAEELRRNYGYRVQHVVDPYEAGRHLENTMVDAVISEAAPAYTAECRLVREISQRSVHLPVIVFVEPENEEDLLDEMGCGTFEVVRPTTPLHEIHQLLQREIGRRQRHRAA